MFDLKIKWVAALAAMVLFVILGCATGKTAQSSPAKNIATGIDPGPNDARIAFITARLMQEVQYSEQQFDQSVSEKFFDGYLESLDPRRENFLQSDIDGFARYRTNLDAYTIGGRGRADLSPAYDIYNRFKERVTQHAAYVKELLKQDKLKFDNDDRIALDRRHAPWPKNLAEAQQLWRDRLRYEFLQEKLGRELSPTNENQILPLNKTNLTDIAAQLQKHYDWTLHMMTNWDSDAILQYYLNALVHAYDPHSDYLNTAHAEDFSIGMSLSLYGIGAQLVEEDGYCTIESLISGGPADKSKQLQPKDKIVAVAQNNQPPVNVVDVELIKVVGMIRGPKGTQVRLTIQPAADSTARRVVTLTREEIKLEDQRAKAKLIESPDGHGGTNRIGVVNVPSFYAPIGLPGNDGHLATNYISTDVATLVKKLEQEKVSGIILDLRTDPGGSLEESVKFAGLFIKDGPIVLARSTDKTVNVYNDPDNSVLYSGPLIVLANRFSASASEIVAGALQDYGRAIIVGDTNTFGKGTVQQLLAIPLPTATSDPGTLKITIRKFYRVSGASTQFKGVASDIVLPDVLNYSSDLGEMALENPLPWDTSAPANYDKLNLVQPHLNELRLRSEVRVATNQDFNYIRQDIDEFKKLQADKTAALNEQEALKEQQKSAAKNKTRAAERAARKMPDEKIYDITVENAMKPGLPTPEPLTVTNENVLLLKTFENGSVSGMSTNQTLLIGLKLNSAETNGSFATVVTKAILPDPVLDETKYILGDYIALMSSTNRILIANHP